MGSGGRRSARAGPAGVAGRGDRRVEPPGRGTRPERCSAAGGIEAQPADGRPDGRVAAPLGLKAVIAGSAGILLLRVSAGGSPRGAGSDGGRGALRGDRDLERGRADAAPAALRKLEPVPFPA